MLQPAQQYQQRKASMAELDKLITPSTYWRFVEVLLEFKAKFQDGDELWEFCSAKHSWDHFAGRAGYIITRNGKTIAELVTSLN
jgi:hypothetical protein